MKDFQEILLARYTRHKLITSSLKGSPCLSTEPQFWLGDPKPGARCGPRECLERVKFCDGACDCRDGQCFDEDSEFCRTWECSKGFFKCRTTGQCVPMSKRCDGQFDCYSGTILRWKS